MNPNTYTTTPFTWCELLWRYDSQMVLFHSSAPFLWKIVSIFKQIYTVGNFFFINRDVTIYGRKAQFACALVFTSMKSKYFNILLAQRWVGFWHVKHMVLLSRRIDWCTPMMQVASFRGKSKMFLYTLVKISKGLCI